MPDVGRVLRGVTQFGTDVDSFLDLAPLITDNLEFGVEYAWDRGNVQVAWFDSTSDFGVRLVPDASGIFTVNREKTEIDGWEISGRFQFTDSLELGVGIALLDGRFDSNDDGKVDADLSAQDVGSGRVNLYLNYRPGENWNLRLQSFTYLDRTFKNAAGNTTAEFDGYTTVDALAIWSIHSSTRLSFGFINLLNEQYLTYYSQAGNTRDDRYTAGLGRTLTLKANFLF